ncbi:hypothetical protein LTR10_007614 [Elasticomyces elasticus]|nr:hypothetical protein LTR10_007614 [Elasticomyces elasticus]KAK4970617.1 hypothetical protein LTR42_007592 [Elasticomyces elasticus]
MNSSGTPRAVDQVIGTPELLETILLLVPVEGHPSNENPYGWHREQRKRLAAVLCSQRVSKAFHSTILGSPCLQRALFFAPTQCPVTARTHPRDRDRTFNSMIRNLTISVDSKGRELQGSFDLFGLYDYWEDDEVLSLSVHDTGRPSVNTYQIEGTESWRKMLVTSVSGDTVRARLRQQHHRMRELGEITSDMTVGEFVNRCIAHLK